MSDTETQVKFIMKSHSLSTEKWENYKQIQSWLYLLYLQYYYWLSAWVDWWISIFSSVISKFIAVASWIASAKASSWSILMISDQYYWLSAWVDWWISIFSTVISGFIAVASWIAWAKASSWSIGSPSDWMVTFCSTRVSCSPSFSQEYVVVSTVLDLENIIKSIIKYKVITRLKILIIF